MCTINRYNLLKKLYDINYNIDCLVYIERERQRERERKSKSRK